MAAQFLVRDDCLKRLRTLCDGDHWRTAFALGSACQLLDLESLNEVVEMTELFNAGAGVTELPEGGNPL